MTISPKIVDDLSPTAVSFVTTVPCKQLAGVIDESRSATKFSTSRPTRKTKAWACALGPSWAASARDHHAEHGHRGDHQHAGDADAVLPDAAADADLYRGELREPVACQVEMAVHTKALAGPDEHPDLPFPLAEGRRESSTTS